MPTIHVEKSWINSYKDIYEIDYTISYGIHPTTFREYLIHNNFITEDDELIISHQEFKSMTLQGIYEGLTFVESTFSGVDLSKASFKKCTFLNNRFSNKTTLSPSFISENLFHLNKFEKTTVLHSGYFSFNHLPLNPYSLNDKKNQANTAYTSQSDELAASNRRAIETIVPSVHNIISNISWLTRWNPVYEKGVDTANKTLLDSTYWLQDNKAVLSQYGYLAGGVGTLMALSMVYSCASMLHQGLGIMIGTMPSYITNPLCITYIAAALYISHQIGATVTNIPDKVYSALAHSTSSTQTFSNLPQNIQDNIISSIPTKAADFVRGKMVIAFDDEMGESTMLASSYSVDISQYSELDSSMVLISSAHINGGSRHVRALRESSLADSVIIAR